jgi:purine-binding chemotaxis protein CheW
MAVIETAAAGSTGAPDPRSPAAGNSAGSAVVGLATSDRYLTFRLGSQVYAVPILDVLEILEYRPLTGVPMMPPFVRGVLNLRGRVVPVIDLATRFGREPTPIDRRTGIVIVDTSRGRNAGGAGRHTGLLVDAVNKVVHFTGDEIEPAPGFGDGVPTGVVSGMARHQDGFIAVLDVAVALSLDGATLSRLDAGAPSA